LAIVITVVCEGLDHRLEFRDDGEVVMLDHSEKLVRSFVAFGAKPPECMEEIDKARERPIKFLIMHLEIDRKLLASLACDFADHALPIWKKYYPNDNRPKKAIHAARKHLVGKIKLATFKLAGTAVFAATLHSEAAAREEWAKSGKAAAAFDVAAFDVAAFHAAASKAAWAARQAWMAASWAVLESEVEASAKRKPDAATRVIIAASDAALAAYYHAKAHGDNPDAAKDAEKKWQIVRFVKLCDSDQRKR
jgi:hypothetical protein